MRNIKPTLLAGHTQETRVASVLTVLILLVLLSGCSTHPQVLASSTPLEAHVIADPTSHHESLSSHAPNTASTPVIRKTSNLGILYQFLEVPVFTHDAEIPPHLVESLRQTIIEHMRQERIFERVVGSSENHENTLILNAHVMSWSEDEIEVNLKVNSRCGCKLGEAQGKGTIQVTELNADDPLDTKGLVYDLNPVAEGAVQYISSVMGVKHG